MKANVNATQKLYVMEFEFSSNELEKIIKECVNSNAEIMTDLGKLLRDTQIAHDRLPTMIMGN